MTFTIPLSILIVLFAIPVVAALWYRFTARAFQNSYQQELEKHIATHEKLLIGKEQYNEIFNKFLQGERFQVTLTTKEGDMLIQDWKPVGKPDAWPSEIESK